MGSASRIEPPGPNYHFPDDKTLVYDAEWRLWNAGTATITMTPEGASRRINGAAISIGFAALLYTVQDRF